MVSQEVEDLSENLPALRERLRYSLKHPFAHGVHTIGQLTGEALWYLLFNEEPPKPEKLK